jgi:tyrosinase
MDTPKDSVLLGMSSGEVVIDGPRTDTRVTLSPAAIQSLVSRLSSAVEEPPAARVYLALEDVQGTHDASILRVHLELPKDTAKHQREFHAGSVALYGIRRASLRHAGSSARGLGFILDITPFFKGLSPARSSLADEIIVSIRPHGGLPAGTTVVIGQIRIFREDHEAGSAPRQ